MPQRGDKRNLVEVEKAKPAEINCADDPESFFELEPGCAHDRISTGACSSLQSALFGQSDETTNLLPSLSLNIA